MVGSTLVNAQSIDLKALQGQHLAGRFFLKTLLGQGGYGAVFEAEQTSVGRRCAVKVLAPRDLNDRKVIERFKMEARATSRLTHPNSVTIYDFGEDEEFGVLFIAMEFLEGEDLSQYVKTHGSFDTTTALHIVEQAAASLDDAHQHGLVHRDVKPQNIMILKRGRDEHFVKVIDFGIAKALEATTAMAPDTQLTMTGTIVGTPQYMSPEQVRDIQLDGRSDQYSLAIVLYVLLTGRPPFLGTSPIDIATKHLTDQPLPPSVIRPELELPPAFEEALLKGLEKQPENRFETTIEFAHALRRGLTGVSAEISSVEIPPLDTAEIATNSPRNVRTDRVEAVDKSTELLDMRSEAEPEKVSVAARSDAAQSQAIPSYATEAVSLPDFEESQRSEGSGPSKARLVFSGGDDVEEGKGFTQVVSSAEMEPLMTAQIPKQAAAKEPVLVEQKKGFPKALLLAPLLMVLLVGVGGWALFQGMSGSSDVEEPVEVVENIDIVPTESPEGSGPESAIASPPEDQPVDPQVLEPVVGAEVKEPPVEPEPAKVEEAAAPTKVESKTEVAKKTKKAEPKEEVVKTGKVSVTLIPWGSLMVGRKSYGDTPRQTIELTEGRHRFYLKQNGETMTSKTVDVVAGQTKIVVLNANER
ncbi:protein kinase [Microvenator marinus]|uniref:non-specific serine/threonine protein kinase n=1 Tax=Microvenator marinus TaxID=2600177 RepID=A0A5B8XMQ7_9DELT|nr:protein kinase [Microvenator marinus]QED26417.1 protein kinase [Microvenator marinus]